MAEYVEKEKLLTDISNGIKAGNYEDGYEQYQNINSMDDIIETIKYSDSADVIERSKVDKAIEEINKLYDDFANSFCEYEQGKNKAIDEVLDIIKRNIGV